MPENVTALASMLARGRVEPDDLRLHLTAAGPSGEVRAALGRVVADNWVLVAVPPECSVALTCESLLLVLGTAMIDDETWVPGDGAEVDVSTPVTLTNHNLTSRPAVALAFTTKEKIQ